MYLVVRGLHCPKGSSLVVVSKGHFPVVGHRLLHCGGFSCCGALGLHPHATCGGLEGVTSGEGRELGGGVRWGAR